MLGLYITIGILIATLLFVLFAALQPKFRQYRLTLKKIEPKKRKSKVTRAKKKKKSVWIKIL